MKSQLSRHLVRLSSQLELLTSAVPPLPVLPTFTAVPLAPTPTPVQYNQVYAPTGTPTVQQQQQAQALAYHQQGGAGYTAPVHGANGSANGSAGTYGMGTGSTNQSAGGYGYNAADERSLSESSELT